VSKMQMIRSMTQGKKKLIS